MAMTEAAMRLLLISNSTQHGSGYLDHAENRRFETLWASGGGLCLFLSRYRIVGTMQQKPRNAFGRWACR